MQTRWQKGINNRINVWIEEYITQKCSKRNFYKEKLPKTGNILCHRKAKEILFAETKRQTHNCCCWFLITKKIEFLS